MVTPAPAKERKPCAPQCLAECDGVCAAETQPTSAQRARRASEIVRRKPEPMGK